MASLCSAISRSDKGADCHVISNSAVRAMSCSRCMNMDKSFLDGFPISSKSSSVSEEMTPVQKQVILHKQTKKMIRHGQCLMFSTSASARKEMDKVTLSVSHNLVKLVRKCSLSPCTQIIPLRHITSVECFHSNPPRIVVQYNTMNSYNRTEIDYSTYEKAQADFVQIMNKLELQ